MSDYPVRPCRGYWRSPCRTHDAQLAASPAMRSWHCPSGCRAGSESPARTRREPPVITRSSQHCQLRLGAINPGSLPSHDRCQTGPNPCNTAPQHHPSPCPLPTTRRKKDSLTHPIAGQIAAPRAGTAWPPHGRPGRRGARRSHDAHERLGLMINRGTESRAARCFASRHRAAMPRHPHIPIRGGRLRAPQPCARQGAPAGQSGDDEAAVMAEAASKQLPPSRHCQGCACMLPACGSAWPSRTFSPPAAGPSRKLRDKSSRKREASPLIRSDRQDPAGQDQAR